MQIRIFNCRQSFASIRQPYKPKDGSGAPKFTFSGICSPETMFEIDSPTKKDESGKPLKVRFPHDKFDMVIKHMCKEKWSKEIAPAKLECFIYARANQQVGSRGPKITEDGDYYEGYDEHTMFFSASTKVEDAPEGILIIDQKRNPLPASSGHPVNGDYVNAIINAFAYEYEGKKGISASLEGIQYLRQGKAFGASKIEASAFDEEDWDDDDNAADASGDDDGCL